MNEYRPLYALFVNALNLKDATSTDFLDYLEHIKIPQNYLTKEGERAKIPLIYGQLNKMAQEGAIMVVKNQIR